MCSTLPSIPIRKRWWRRPRVCPAQLAKRLRRRAGGAIDRARTGSNPRAIEDMVDYSRLRRTMVDNQLRTSDITDWRILDAMNRVPREHFVPRHQVPFAYSEAQIELSPARAMLKPADFAR